MPFIYNKLNPVLIPSEKNRLEGLLYVPSDARGLVIFVHGSGSSRFSIRNQHIAEQLNDVNLATLLFDLLTPEEETIDSATAEFRFNIQLLASRLMDVTNWCQKELPNLSLGYFGASTGGGAALVAAAEMSSSIRAVVSRGGRPDLAGEFLSKVEAPTLLIVGGNDEPVIKMNQDAMLQMNCVSDLKIVPDATHLFEEPGALDQVGNLSKVWFLKYLANENLF